MPSFSGLLIVVAVAFAAPFVLGLFPSVRLPSVVLEILAGIVIVPSVLGIVEVNELMIPHRPVRRGRGGGEEKAYQRNDRAGLS